MLMLETDYYSRLGGIDLGRITVYECETRLSELIAAGYTIDFSNRDYVEESPVMRLEVFDDERRIGYCLVYDVPGDATPEYLSRQTFAEFNLEQPNKPRHQLLKRIVKYAVVPFVLHLLLAIGFYLFCTNPGVSEVVARSLRAGGFFIILFLLIVFLPASVSTALWSSAFPTYSRIKQRLIGTGFALLNCAISASYLAPIYINYW